MTTPEITQLLSAAIALVAVVVGPFITLQVAKRQIDSAKAVADLQARVTVVSKNRQDWINTLRLEIAGFVSDVTMVLPLLFAGNQSIEMHKLLSQVQLHLARTKLLINPREDDHKALVEKMEEMANHVLSFKGFPVEQTRELVSISQAILKREWERVKAFT